SLSEPTNSSESLARAARIRLVLDVIIETLVPAIAESPPEVTTQVSALRGSDLDIRGHLLRKLERSPHRKFLERLLLRLEVPLWNAVVFGRRRAISEMSLEQRTELLWRWSRSNHESLRIAWLELARPCLYTAYAKPLANGRHPLWEAIGYGTAPTSITPPEPDEASSSPVASEATHQNGSQVPDALPGPTRARSNGAIDGSPDYDVIVVGSGAGGSVVAHSLTRAGMRVLVLEAGRFVSRSELGQGEWDGNRKLFDKQGSLATDDGRITLLAGRGVGGGTVVNWMTTLETPDYVLRQWQRELGVDLHDAEWLQSLTFIQQRLDVSISERSVNPHNRLLQLGCERLGKRWRLLPRNARCSDCDLCNFGCPQGNKRDARRAFLDEAIASGAELWADTTVSRLLHSNSRVHGVEVRRRRADGNVEQIRVTADRVVLAAGALHTPGLILRSGLGNAHVGRHLALHPTAVVTSRFPKPVHPWRGAPQSVMSHEWERLTSNGLGVRLEVAPMHPGFAALAIPWR
ncbi:MAG: FAD-dependent oxidoreductase, partial [Pirellulaceae bacterium]